MKSVISTGSGHRIFAVDSEALLLHDGTRRLYHLNTAAAYIWFCLEQGLDSVAACEAVTSQFGIERSRAERDVSAMINAWVGEGLLDIGDAASRRIPSTTDRGADEMPGPRGRGSSKPMPGPKGRARPRRLCDHFIFRCLVGEAVLCAGCPSSDIGDLLRCALGHLEIAADDRQLDAMLPRIDLEIVQEHTGYSVYCDGYCATSPVARNELAPAIVREALIGAYEHSACLLGVHAGAVSSGERCVLLPGRSGSGKSTLTAALTHAGFTFLTDELALIMPDRHVIRGLPVGVGLKEGAWNVLASRFPCVADLPTHYQADGTAVRYLRPGEIRLPQDTQRMVSASAIVFPEYREHGETRLEPLTAAAALYRLSLAGYAVPGGHNTPDLVQRLIDWIRSVPCYALQVGDLDAGVRALASILMPPRGAVASQTGDASIKNLRRSRAEKPTSRGEAGA